MKCIITVEQLNHIYIKKRILNSQAVRDLNIIPSQTTVGPAQYKYLAPIYRHKFQVRVGIQSEAWSTILQSVA